MACAPGLHLGGVRRSSRSPTPISGRDRRDSSRSGLASPRPEHPPSGKGKPKPLYRFGTPISSAVALAWVRSRPGVASTLIGVRRPDQLQANLAALDLILTDAQIAKLNEVSKPALNFPADINKSWLGKFQQSDKWSFCLTAARMAADQERVDDETSAPEATDITYIPMARGFVYLTAVVDWFSRRVLSWRVSITMEAEFCIEALEEALAKHGTPDIWRPACVARAYSLDLRERVVAAVLRGLSCRAVAVRFDVSVASVVKWAQRARATGSPAARPMGGKRPYLLAGQRGWLLARLDEKPDLTLHALLRELGA
jgi:transposase-like protein